MLCVRIDMEQLSQPTRETDDTADTEAPTLDDIIAEYARSRQSEEKSQT